MSKKVQGAKIDDLREHLASQTQAAISEAKDYDGEISAEKLESLERLARLVEINQRLEKPTSRKRWPVILVLMVTGLFISFLLTPISTMEIELELTLTDLEFTIPKHQDLTQDVLEISSIGASGLQTIVFPNILEIETSIDSSSRMSNNRIRISTQLATNGPQGNLSLEQVLVSGNTRIHVSNTAIPSQFRISLFKDQARIPKASASNGSSLPEKNEESVTLKPIRIGAHGPIKIESPQIHRQKIDLKIPKSFRLTPGPESFNLDFTLPADKSINFATQILANDFSFYRIDEHIDLDHSLSRKRSTILSGAYYLESLNNEKRLVRPGEMIQFRHIQGLIRELQLEGDKITLKFHGTVNGMHSGSGDNLRSLMPSRLERLKSHHHLTLFWGATLNIFLLILSILKWWGIKI